MTKQNTRSLIVLACLLALSPWAWANQGTDPQAFTVSPWRCSLAGTWIGENDAGFVFVITITPLDATHRRFSTVADPSANPPAGAGFMTAVDGTAFHGEAYRTGPGTFRQTALNYLRDEFSWIGTFAVSGTWTLGEDCQTARVVWYGAAYAPTQDPFNDEPLFCLPPITGTYRRVPVVRSACEP